MLGQPTLSWGGGANPERVMGGEGTYCWECHISSGVTGMANAVTASISNIAKHVGRMFRSPVAIDASRSSKKWNAGCTTFIENDGSYGPTGVMLLDELNPAKYPALFSNDIRDFRAICPNWVTMQEHERKAFLIYAFAALANQESGCNPKSTTAKGEAGFLSLPFRRHSTVDIVCNSDPVTAAPNKNWAPLDGRANLICGMKFIESQLVGLSPAQTRRLGVKMPVSHTFFALGSHFGPLRPFANSGAGGAEKVRARLAEYTPCGTNYRTMSAQLNGGRAYVRGFNTPIAEAPRLAATAPPAPSIPQPTKFAERGTATTAAAN